MEPTNRLTQSALMILHQKGIRKNEHFSIDETNV